MGITRRGVAIGGLAPLVLACALVAIGNVATKAVIDDAPVVPALLVQVAASTILIAALAARAGCLPRLPRDWRLMLPGLLQPGLGYILSFYGLKLIPVSIVGLLFALEAGMVALLAWPLLGERPTVRVAVAVVVGTAGVVLLGGAMPSGGVVAPIGIALVTGGVACAALDTVATRFLANDANPLTFTLASHLAALILVAVATPLTGPHDWRFLARGGDVATIAVAGMLIHGLATVLFIHALAHLPAAFAAALFPLISLLTLAGGVLFLHDRLGGTQYAGGALIITSALLVVWCVERRERQRVARD